MKDTTTAPEPHQLLRDPLHLVSLGFGTGCAPVMPGTCGTLIGVVIYLALIPLPLLQYLGACLLGFAVGVALCGRTGDVLGISDHPAIVWDEVVGYLIAMVALPAEWQWMLAGFIAFRLFDIVKPWPVGWLDRHLKGGLGVMSDDLAAGIMACGLLHLFLYLL